MMELNPLTAIGPVDGRYRSQVLPLAPYFSEYGLIHYRVRVEIEYFLFLADIGIFNLPQPVAARELHAIWQNFTEADAMAIKDIESTTNHDVKAVEYFLKSKLQTIGAADVMEWVHFGLTSQDINNTAVPMLWRDALTVVYLPALEEMASAIRRNTSRWKNVAMLARTHGQPASPTTMGKEWMVFAERIEGQLRLLKQIPFAAKFGGATGNFNAHQVAFPERDWPTLANGFVADRLGLNRMQFTTQIEHYDHLAAQMDTLKRINTILIDFCRDMWTYISLDYFTQKVKEGEVGSSAMPHKVNPIDFENAEGNLGLANALYEHMSAKLPVSRLQRDLTDSTVLRNLGLPLAHSFIALRSLQKGIGKIILHEKKIADDLDRNWAVVAEAIQTILRRENYPQPYEALKALTRGQQGITREGIHSFIGSLNITDAVKAELMAITPHNYVGVPFDL